MTRFNFLPLFTLLVVGIAFAESQTIDPNCTKTQLHIDEGAYEPNDNTTCIDPCDTSGYEIRGEENCTKAKFCHWVAEQKICVLLKINVSLEQQFTATSGLENFLDPDAQGRTSLLGPNPGCGPLKGFPFECFLPPHNVNPQAPDFLAKLPGLLAPPVDIPYCLRIPCSHDPSLELNRAACLLQPGCYFDYELANIRAVFGHSILPGVPVCHLVIRNQKFHELAADSQQNGAPWNPFFTQCFLSVHGLEIYKPPCGCDAVRAMLHYGGWPKQIWWPGIKEKWCILLGGCWINGICYAPAKAKSLHIKAGDDKYRHVYPVGVDLYGQPRCQPFNIKGKAPDFLNSYHCCKRAGCVVDPDIDAKKIRQQLCNIAKSDLVPNCLKLQFWNKVQNNEIRPDNWQEVLEKMKYCKCPRITLPQIFGPIPFSGSPRSGNASATSPRTGGNVFLPGCTFFPGLKFPFGPGNPPTFPGLIPPPQGVGNPFIPGSKYIPPCPYQPHPIPGYPLTGSSAGCCERHYCYCPRSDVRNAYSGDANYFYEWEKWLPCSKECGGGFRKRIRKCIVEKCEGEKEQTERCNDIKCASWAPWGPWRKCSATCGGNGKQVRTRACRPAGKKCPGRGRQQRKCNTGRCPVLSKWTTWTQCGSGSSCGPGTKTRTRRCTNGGAFGCKNEKKSLKQTMKCIIYCGKCEAGRRGSCVWVQNRFRCLQTVTYECKHQGKRGWCVDPCRPRQVRCSGCRRPFPFG